jgi:hypothetical protein
MKWPWAILGNIAAMEEESYTKTRIGFTISRAGIEPGLPK